MSLTDWAALLGMVFGTIGLTVGTLGYLRDRPRVKVKLEWDYRTVGAPGGDAGQMLGAVTVTNVGRRPIYLSHVALKLPKRHEQRYLLLAQGIHGRRLAEGDPPALFTLDQSQAKPYASDWKKIRARVIDSAGKEYISRQVKTRPSWAK